MAMSPNRSETWWPPMYLREFKKFYQGLPTDGNQRVVLFLYKADKKITIKK